MPKSSKERIGLPPGSIVYTGNKKAAKITLHHLQYNFETFQILKLDNHSKFVIDANQNFVDWYDIRGIHDTKLIEKIGDVFQIHNLILEDIVDVNQRPKFEEFDNGILLILKSPTFNSKTLGVTFEHIAIILKDGVLISFQEEHSDIFLPIRDRIESAKGKIRNQKADYLAYALTDFLVDQQYAVMEDIEEEVEKLELHLLSNPQKNIKEEIFSLKRQIIILRKEVVPLKEAINKFSKSDHQLIKDSSKIFIMDLYDHTFQLTDMIDSNREILNGLQDLYLSEISFKMNKIMQILTIITTVFVPLSFLTSLYGMNFKYMPELNFKYGYFILLGIMLLISACLLIWFRKNKWL